MKGDSGYLGFERVDGISRDATGTSAADVQVQCPQCGAWYPAWKEHHCPQVSSGSTAPTDGIVWIKYKPLGEPHEPGIIEELSAQIESLQAKIAEQEKLLREMAADSDRAAGLLVGRAQSIGKYKPETISPYDLGAVAELDKKLERRRLLGIE